MKELYLSIKARLELMATDIKFIHVFNDQFNQLAAGESYSFPMPCVFIEFPNDQNLQQLGAGYQIYNPLTIAIHIGHNQLDAADGTIEQNLNIFDVKQAVYAALQKFTPTGASQFIRTSETQDYAHTNVYHFIQTYTTTYIDKQQTEPIGGVNSPAPLTLDLDVEYDPSPVTKTIQ